MSHAIDAPADRSNAGPEPPNAAQPDAKAEAPAKKSPAAVSHNEGRLTRAIALMLMAFATLGSAWSGFQAGLWNGIQTFHLADATKASRISSQDALLASQERNLDAAIFIEYARAISEHNSLLATFLHERLSPELRPAMDAWLATKPLKNKNAPTSPFVMPEYRIKFQQDASDLDLQAAVMRNQAQQANLTGDTYTLDVLLFTSGLFMAGLVTGFDETRIRWVAIVLSLAFSILASGLLTSVPIAHRG